GAVKANPVVFPRVGGVSGIGVELIGLDKEQVAFLQMKGSAAHLKDPLACDDQMDQVMIAHAGTPGMPGLADFMPAAEDRKLDIVGITLFVRLLEQIRHSIPPPAKPENTHFLYYNNRFIKSP